MSRKILNFFCFFYLSSPSLLYCVLNNMLLKIFTQYSLFFYLDKFLDINLFVSYTMTKRWTMKKSIFILGLSSDIGKAIAIKFAKNNYDIYGTYYTGNTTDLENEIAFTGSRIITFQLDCLDYKRMQHIFTEVFNSADFIESVICVYGVSKKENLILDYQEDEIDNIVNINLTSVIKANKLAFAHFLKQKSGSIINISSIYGIYGGACEVAYSASKAGLVGLTKALAQECSPFGIRVNSVAPGCIDTKMTSFLKEEDKKKIIESTPLQRLGKGMDVANAVFFLSSNDASFITGQILGVDGGATTC